MKLAVSKVLAIIIQYYSNKIAVKIVLSETYDFGLILIIFDVLIISSCWKKISGD